MNEETRRKEQKEHIIGYLYGLMAFGISMINFEIMFWVFSFLPSEQVMRLSVAWAVAIGMFLTIKVKEIYEFFKIER